MKLFKMVSRHFNFIDLGWKKNSILLVRSPKFHTESAIFFCVECSNIFNEILFSSTAIKKIVRRIKFLTAISDTKNV
jgi:hypothetical protein